MVAAYRVPKACLQAINTEEIEEALRVVDEDLVPDDLMEDDDRSACPERDEEDRGLHVCVAGDEELPCLEEPEEPPEMDKRKELEEKVKELQKPVEMVTIYLARPMRRRTGQAALTAVQELVLQLSRAGLPVRTLHSDRAREFGTLQLRTWLTQQQIAQTKTSGGEPAGNSSAELGVKWFKSRTRALLRTSGAPPTDWPMAASHAAATLWRRAFPDTPLYRGHQAAFGQTVWYKAKDYKGVKEKELDQVANKDLPLRWKKASYRGPMMEVPEGHLLQREDGGLTIAKGLKAGVWEPHQEDPPLLPGVEVVEVDGEDPSTPTRRRLKGKVTMKMLVSEDQTPDQLGYFEEFDPDHFEEKEVKKEGQLDGLPTTSLKKILKKTEVQYTENVEDLLNSLDQANQGLEVTHNVSLDEVKKNLAAWVKPSEKEYLNLRDNKSAFQVVTRADLPDTCRIVPGKAVFTVKPDKSGYRRKTRFVACGNHIPADDLLCDLYAAGVDAASLRTLLTMAAGKDWKIGSTDIRQAFVLAPWSGSPVAIQPPAVAAQLGLTRPGELWLVKQAIYGLRESPAVWSEFRDKELREARWKTTRAGVQVECRLEQLVSDSQIWRITTVGDRDLTLGYVIVYVDDVLAMGEETALKDFYGWIAEKWECDDWTMLSEKTPIRFLGMELFESKDGYELGQKGFIQELLRSHDHQGGCSLSQGARDALVMTAEEEEAIIQESPPVTSSDDPILKQAQRRVGELLWLVSRTRPDLQYLVAVMSSRVTRNPEAVSAIGKRVLNYLAATINYRLTFRRSSASSDLHVYTDSSFAPSSGRSHGAAAVFWQDSPLAWRSARQPLVTLSTAESELIEAVEGALLGLSNLGLVQELTGKIPMIYIHVDNQAALALSSGSSGSWRTRHLRLRMNWLRERITNGEMKMLYEPGLTQRADLGTKALPKERLKQLVELWGFRDHQVEPRAIAKLKNDKVISSTTSKPNSSGWTSWLAKLAMICQGCGAKGQATVNADSVVSDSGIPYELYMLVVIVALLAVMAWECAKGWSSVRISRLRTLANRAERPMTDTTRLSRVELRELQGLLGQDPGELTLQQAGRLLELRTRFGMEAGSRRRQHGALHPSPELQDVGRGLRQPERGALPELPQPLLWPGETPESTAAATSSSARDEPLGHQLRDPQLGASLASSSTPLSRPTVRTCEIGTQTEAPAFTLMEPNPVQTIRLQEVIPEGPYFHVPGRSHVHLFRDCWGLRNASNLEPLMMCRCCHQNDGRCMYGAEAGQRGRGG